MIDSHFRSIVGLQTLIQKEWVVMGHQFCTRLGHINSTDSVKVKNVYCIFSIYLLLLVFSYHNAFLRIKILFNFTKIKILSFKSINVYLYLSLMYNNNISVD